MPDIGKEEKIRGIVAKEIYKRGGGGRQKSYLGDRGSWRKNAGWGMPEEG